MRSAWRKIGVFSLSGCQLNSKEWRGARTQVRSTCSTDVISDSNALSRIAIVIMSIYDRIENETSPGRRERDSERDKESEELELERGRMRACKKVQQNENRVCKMGADLAMRKQNENRSHKTDVDLAMRKLDGKYGASIKKD